LGFFAVIAAGGSKISNYKQGKMFVLRPILQKVNSLFASIFFHFKLADKKPTLTFAAEIENRPLFTVFSV